MHEHGSHTLVSSYTLLPAFYIPIFELDATCLNPSGLQLPVCRLGLLLQFICEIANSIVGTDMILMDICMHICIYMHICICIYIYKCIYTYNN